MTSNPEQAPCLICGTELNFRLVHGRKSKKPFVMLLCPEDGRHFRAFISDQAYVKKILDLLGTHQELPQGDLP